MMSLLVCSAEAQQEALDTTLAALGPVFASETGKAVQLADECKDALEQLDHRYEPISYLCQDSKTRAEAFKEQLLDAVKQHRSAVCGSVNKEKHEAVEGAAGEHESTEKSATEVPASPVPDALASIRGHAAKRLAELCTAQVQQLYNSGASIAAPAR